MKKVIVITGASSGMGKDTALKLINEGHIVYGLARRADKMQDLVDAGGYALGVDITNSEMIAEVVSKIIAEQHHIDVLWNNAGYSVTGAVEDVSEEDAKRQFDVNLFGLAEMTKAVLPHMREQRSGTIINTSSVGGKIYSPLGAWYHATKHALEAWSDCLRLELKPFNINVVILQPGGISTEFGDVLVEPLLTRSKGGAYEEISSDIAYMYKKIYTSSKNMAPTSVISQVISKIIRTKKTKTRYAAGYMAKTTLFMKFIMSDKLFDKFIISTFKKEKTR
ncbi:oxidoreductase [Vibrio parahaemolyticus]|uniref:oxidoreductase n=1 Tax=Vibrio parahaemolyticus TaxID=670 RepID=UPI002362D6D8|nr:oxidoreductase [Vibrio parahaemolyticus]